MPAARKPKAAAKPKAEPKPVELVVDVVETTVHDVKGAVYALVHLLPNFKPGDRIDGHFTKEVCDLIVQNGDASRTRPKA
jgi:hypothetical protein